MKNVYLLAHPAGHRVSPAMHNAAFRELGIVADYTAWDVAPSDLAAAVEVLRKEEVYGANVTVPHKVAVLPLMDELSSAAQAIGAVNTIVNRDGRLEGHNTDAAGFIRALVKDAGFVVNNKRVVMLGAGGAARAVAYGLLTEGIRELSVVNRTVEKAHDLAASFSQLGTIKVLVEEDLEEAVRAADLLVNTTSVGMERGGVDERLSPLSADVLPAQGIVSDLVYRPAQTRLLVDAERSGLTVQNGLPMLVYQGAEAFEHWTGRAAPEATMLEAARNALAGAS